MRRLFSKEEKSPDSKTESVPPRRQKHLNLSRSFQGEDKLIIVILSFYKTILWNTEESLPFPNATSQLVYCTRQKEEWTSVF